MKNDFFQPGTYLKYSRAAELRIRSLALVGELTAELLLISKHCFVFQGLLHVVHGSSAVKDFMKKCIALMKTILFH